MSNPTVEQIEEILHNHFDDGDYEDGWYSWKEVSGKGFTDRFTESGTPEIGWPRPYIHDGKVVAEHANRKNDWQTQYRDATPEEQSAQVAYDNYIAAFKEFKKALKLEDDYINVPGLGRVTVVEIFGGEGEGDRYYLVFRVEAEDGTVRFFKMNGWYASHDGGHFDGPFEEVKAVEKTITVYQ